MYVWARLVLVAALPALAGRAAWCAGGEVVRAGEAAGAGGAAGEAAGAGGGGPEFAPRQRTAAVAAAGQSAALECQVLRLGDKVVSWVRSRDLQILTHAGGVFTADARVSAAESRAAGAGAASRHALRLARLRAADAGRYECQLNTDPKMSLFFNLTVLDEPVPTVEVTAERSTVEGTPGGAATLACAARYSPAPRDLPLPPLDVSWRRGALPLQAARGGGGGGGGGGGVSLDTERWAARVVSRVTLAGLRAEDAGEWRCAAGGASAAVRLVLREGEEQMEMQRDQSAGAGAGASGGRGGRGLSALALLAAATLAQL